MKWKAYWKNSTCLIYLESGEIEPTEKRWAKPRNGAAPPAWDWHRVLVRGTLRDTAQRGGAHAGSPPPR